ncbi:hypothetical protein COOONC_06587 [Cooperia oncophora]
MATGNVIPEKYETLTPILKTPISDIFAIPLSQQGRPCGFFEAQFFRCMEAYGAKLGRKYCDLEHRDFKECVTSEKQLKNDNDGVEGKKKIDECSSVWIKETRRSKDSKSGMGFMGNMSTRNKASEEIEFTPGPSSPGSLFGQDWQERRAYVQPSDNIVIMLAERERGYARNGVRHVRNRREFYSTVAMDRVVEVPEARHLQDHVVSWTPDGSRLITFRVNLRSIRIFRYLGVESARSSSAEDICGRLFELESEVTMMMGTSRLESASLRTDCMLFTDDGNYMIVATTAPAPDQLLTIPMAYPNTEALPVTNYSLEIYTFFTIDIKKGSVAHFVMYNFDRINLTHGVALCGTTMMIMSLQKQVIIHMLHVDEFGAMIPLKDIGASIWDDDGLYLFGDCQATPTRTSLYTGLKQRLLTFLYKEAKREGNVEEFLRLTPSYVEKLRMHRAQLFDGHYLLVRMLPHTSIRYDIALMPCFLFILDWRDCEILAVYQEYGPELLAFYENFVEVLLTPTQNPHRYPKSFQYNPHSKQKAHWLMGNSSGMMNLFSAMSEGMYRRVLSVLPFCGCHLTFSIHHQKIHYLDPLYFSIDEKVHSNLMYGRMRFDLGPVNKMRTTATVREMHVALVGMTGSGKSAIAVKYITKRFIGEYDSGLGESVLHLLR